MERSVRKLLEGFSLLYGIHAPIDIISKQKQPKNGFDFHHRILLFSIRYLIVFYVSYFLLFLKAHLAVIDDSVLWIVGTSNHRPGFILLRLPSNCEPANKL